MKSLLRLMIAVLLLPACTTHNQTAAQSGQLPPRIDTVFAIIGDFGTGDGHAQAVARLVKGWRPNFIATVGDNSYDNDDDSGALQKNVGDVYTYYLTDSTFYTCPGNHDHHNHPDSTLRKYESYFHRDRNYHVAMAKDFCYLYFLDSGWDGDSNGGILDAETKDSLLSWLRADTLPYFKLVFFHHAVYSDGWHACNTRTQIGFDTLGVDAVINGHDHLYEKIVPRDGSRKKPLYLVDGSGGARLYTKLKPQCIPADMVVQGRDDKDYGALKVLCSPHRLNFCFYDTTGRLVDSTIITRD